MNIYLLSDRPKQSAKWHMDKHVIGMPGVYNQILANVYWIFHDDMPSTIKINEMQSYTKSEFFAMLPDANKEDHPVCRWAADSMGNFAQVLMLSDFLHKEYFNRFGSQIGSSDIPVLCNQAMRNLPLYGDGTASVTLTPFPVRAQRGIKIPERQTSIKYKTSTYLPLGDIKSVCTYLWEIYKREARNEMQRRNCRVADLYKNCDPPKWLSTLETIIIPNG